MLFLGFNFTYETVKMVLLKKRFIYYIIVIILYMIYFIGLSMIKGLLTMSFDIEMYLTSIILCNNQPTDFSGC